MPPPPALKSALKRGALVAAANWPLVAVQFIAGGTLKLLLAVPVVGGAFLVVLLPGADAEGVLAWDPRQIVTSVFGALRENPAALTAFAAAFLIVLLGGSALTFIVKGGTVTILATAEAEAGPIERPPLRLEAVRRASRTNIESFLAGCQRLWRRYIKLGAILLFLYTATGGAYLAFVFFGYSLSDHSSVILAWTILTVLVSVALVVWITLINFLYLLTQMVIAVEDVGVREGIRRLARFLQTSFREIVGIFGVVLVLVGLAIAASILATGGLSLIAFVPLVGLAFIPLQVAAWLLQNFVLEYLALTALGAYLTQYRHYARGQGAAPVKEAS